MKTILATAYAVNPYKGSEDGMGWNFVLQIARFNKVIPITRENNRPHIEKYMAENPSELYANIEFLYFDLPYWMRFWKKGGRGAMLYYWMWQRGVVSFLNKKKPHFDISHNLNFHNDWTPSYLWKLGKPFVWGPVGHHPIIPAQYLSQYKKSYYLKDRLTWMVKQYFWRFSSGISKAKNNAAHILCMNDGVPHRLKLTGKYSVRPSVATQDFGWNQSVSETGKFTLISAGRFVPLKGFDLTIRSFANFFHDLNADQKESCELILVGSGPEKTLLKSLAIELKVDTQVKFISWIERNTLMQMFKEASVFLFPSHEGAGMVVAEALSFGLPVICLDNEGPGQYITQDCGHTIGQGDYQNTVLALGNAISDVFNNPDKRQDMRLAARRRFESLFHWDNRGEQLKNIYSEL